MEKMAQHQNVTLYVDLNSHSGRLPPIQYNIKANYVEAIFLSHRHP